MGLGYYLHSSLSFRFCRVAADSVVGQFDHHRRLPIPPGPDLEKHLHSDLHIVFDTGCPIIPLNEFLSTLNIPERFAIT